MPPSWTTFGGPNDGSSITPTVQSLFRNKYTTHLQWRQRQHNHDSADAEDFDYVNEEDTTTTQPPLEDVEQQKRIRLPNLKYGYRTVPLEWDEIVYAVNYDLARLSRSVTQQRDYEIYKRDLLQREQWQSVLDHVLCTKFPHIFRPITVPVTVDTAGVNIVSAPVVEEEEEPQQAPDDPGSEPQIGRHQQRAHPTLKEALAALALSPATTTTKTTALLRNDFPYYMADGLEHWVLWKLGGPCSGDDVTRAQQELADQHGLDPNYMIHWVNPPQLQSLPAIDHVHIIGRRRKVDRPQGKV